MRDRTRSIPDREVTARGSSKINVFSRWDVDILNALHLVQGRIYHITPSLPPGTHLEYRTGLLGKR